MNAYHRYYRAALLPQHGRAWLDHLEHEGRSVRTLATYAAALVNLRRFLQSSRAANIGVVTRTELCAWQESLLACGCSASTREQFTRTVRYWFQWLHRRGLLFANPASTFVLPKLQCRLPRCPSEEQMRHLLGAMPRRGAVAWRNRALVELAYASGARLEELSRLQLGSLDLEHGIVRLLGKGNRERAIPLTQLAVRSLRHYLRRERPHLMRAADDSAALFIGVRDGAALDAPGIAHVIQRAGRRIGLTITPHDLRRAFATHLLRGGAHVAEVRLLLGHRSYRHLASYVKLNPERLTERFLGR